MPEYFGTNSSRDMAQASQELQWFSNIETTFVCLILLPLSPLFQGQRSENEAQCFIGADQRLRVSEDITGYTAAIQTEPLRDNIPSNGSQRTPSCPAVLLYEASPGHMAGAFH